MAEYVKLRERRASEVAAKIDSTQYNLTDLRRRLLASCTASE